MPDVTTAVPSKPFPAALSCRHTCKFESDMPLPAVRNMATGAAEKYVHKYVRSAVAGLTVDWKEWAVDISGAGSMKVLGMTDPTTVATVRADLIGCVTVGRSDIPVDIRISREGRFFPELDAEAPRGVLTGVNCRDFVDDLFRLPEHDPMFLANRGRRSISWLDQDFPEITLSLYGVVIQPTVDIHDAIAECKRARDRASIGSR